jgi:hypothetical protein
MLLRALLLDQSVTLLELIALTIYRKQRLRYSPRWILAADTFVERSECLNVSYNIR